MFYLCRQQGVQTSFKATEIFVLFKCLLLTALEQDVAVALDENVTSSLLDTVRKHSENEELLSLVCTLLMMISASGGSPCSFLENILTFLLL